MSIFTEVFACFGDRESGLPDQVDCEVAQRCEGSCSCADAAAVLGEGDVADVVEAVLDAPVGPGKLEQTLWPGLLGREACDQIDDLDGLAAADLAAALEPGALRRAAPSLSDWFDADRQDVCILPGRLAEILGIQAEHLGRARIHLMGHPGG